MTFIKPFIIKEVDLLTVKRLIQYARFNAKNDWGTAIRMLLDYVDTDAKNIMLYNRMLEFETRLERLEASLEEKEPEKKKVRGFGPKQIQEEKND
jgi:hypothetical protein